MSEWDKLRCLKRLWYCPGYVLYTAGSCNRDSRKPSQTVRPGHDRPRSRSIVMPHSRMTQRPTISPEMYLRKLSSEPSRLRKLLMFKCGSNDIVMRGCASKLVIDLSTLWLSLGRPLSITLDALAVLGLLATDGAGEPDWSREKRDVDVETADVVDPERESVDVEAGTCLVFVGLGGVDTAGLASGDAAIRRSCTELRVRGGSWLPASTFTGGMPFPTPAFIPEGWVKGAPVSGLASRRSSIAVGDVSSIRDIRLEPFGGCCACIAIGFVTAVAAARAGPV